MFKKFNLLVATFLVAFLSTFMLAGCSDASPEAKLKKQMSLIHPLDAAERNLAQINGKQFFEKEWLPAGGKRGQLISCKPSDSNANGLVTCTGFVPQAAGNFTEVTRYCGYTPELVGCSAEDTVK